MDAILHFQQYDNLIVRHAEGSPDLETIKAAEWLEVSVKDLER